MFCKCQFDAAASVWVNGAALLCSLAQIINHEPGHILVVPVLSLLGLIKQFCELESEIPLLQIIINYGESAQRCWTQLYSAQPWQRVIHCAEHSTDLLSLLITNLHFCKLGSASQQTKNYVLLFSLQTCWRSTDQLRLEVFCVEWWGSAWYRGGGQGNELTLLTLWLYYTVWCRQPPTLLRMGIEVTDYAHQGFVMFFFPILWPII